MANEMNQHSRYQQVSRRRMLQGATAAAVTALLAACGKSDAEIFADTTTSSPASSSSLVQEPTAEATSTTRPETSTTAAESTQSTPATTTVSDSGSEPTELAVAFSYNFGSTGKRLNPYIAVWIEDADGNLVRTIALWFQQDTKGPRWLRDLKRWFVVDGARDGPDAIETVSSATRLPGSYQLAWDGLDDAGQVVGGSVFVCIEAARERGPYSLIREPYDLAGDTSLPLPDEGELSLASVNRT